MLISISFVAINSSSLVLQLEHFTKNCERILGLKYFTEHHVFIIHYYRVSIGQITRN